MNTTFYNQLLTDIQGYIKAQYQLLQVKSVEKTSQIIGLIVGAIIAIVMIVIALIFLAIAFAAWLEYWLPMWASYLIVAVATIIMASIIVLGRKIWFVRPVQKQLTKMTMESKQPLEEQKKTIENQVAMQQACIERDMGEMQHEWSKMKLILHTIGDLISPPKESNG